MTNPSDPIASRTRQVVHLRGQVARRGRAAPCADLTERALEMCDVLLRDFAGAHLEYECLRAEAGASAAERDYLFEMMPGACLMSDSAGRIVKANRAAAALLNFSARALKDRELVLFAGGREDFGALLQRLSPGGEVRTTLSFRPRDRKAVALDVVVMPFAADRSDVWLWFLTPVTETHGTGRFDARGHTGSSQPFR